MTEGRGAVPPRDLLRFAILALLVLAPLAFGSVHEPASIPLLAVAFLAGLLSWARGHWGRAHGESVPRFPAAGLLLALHVLVLLQLVPLPPALLRLLSPGSYAFRAEASLVPIVAWEPVSVSPPDTLRGLLFLGGMTLLAATAFREFDDVRWRRRLAATVVATGLVVCVLALLQAASAEPTKIYGLWRPAEDWGVFGPYVNRNHFAGYVAMATALALGFAAQAFRELRRSWSRRRVGWLALGDAAGSATLGRSAVALTLIVGLLASQSRGGLMAFILSTAAMPLLLRRRSAAVLVVGLAVAGLAWVGVSGFVLAFESRGIGASRLDLWRDALHLVPRYPLLGVGLNALGTAYPPHQTYFKSVWWGEVDNEYLQVLVDTGIVGALVAGFLLVRLFGAAVRGARHGAFETGVAGALFAAAFSNLVESNWQIPANAATFAALAGVALRAEGDARTDPP